MKSLTSIIFITLIAGVAGGVSSQFFTQNTSSSPETTKLDAATPVSSPFSIVDTPSNTNEETLQLQYRVAQLEQQLKALQQQLADIQNIEPVSIEAVTEVKKPKPVRRSMTPNKNDLIEAGVSPDVAEDLMRQLGQYQFRRMELQNLIQRSDSAQRREYNAELRQLNQNKISLREEIGDEAYDKYLFASGQNNRVKVSSVMAGSPAESAGFMADDVIVYYDNKKVLNWSDIRRATIEGEIGSYTSVEIIRDGQQMSIMVPRGTLGVQLDTAQLDPNQ